MTVPEFENNISILHEVLFGTNMQRLESTTPSYFHALDAFTYLTAAKNYPFFSTLEKTPDNNIEFSINSRQEDIFRVNKDEAERNDDPVPFIKVQDEWQSYDFTLSTLLLTEYVYWLSKQTSHQFKLSFSGYDIYVPVKKYWKQFFNPFSYPNKIWVGKTIKSIIYIQNETGSLVCMASNAGSLQQAQTFLNEK